MPGNIESIQIIPEENRAAIIQKLNKFIRIVEKRRKTRFISILPCILAIVLLAWIPDFTRPIMLILIILVFVVIYLAMKFMHTDSLRLQLKTGITAVSEITVKEVSLGGSMNYILAEGDEKEFIARSVYGSCKQGDSVLKIEYKKGPVDIVCQDFLKE